MAKPKHDGQAGGAWGALGFACVLAFATALVATPWARAADDDELPASVGRIAEVGGELLLAPQDRPTDWAPVGINYPVATGDNLWVSADGRAEIDYGPGQFRLAGETSVHVSRLEDRELALFVAQGRLIVRVRHLERGEVATVDTPNTQVSLTRPGLYRIDVAADRSTTTVIVREGEALAAIAGGAQQVLPGQAAILAGVDPAFADVRAGAGIDGFDAWSADRERVYRHSRAANYVSSQMPGWVELDQHGTWDAHPTYGAVWYPTVVVAGWAPYRFGRWAYTGRWGWTWVDDAPWGYAPSHYGRWAWIGGRWGWCPGAFVARPVWAPALVGWVGGSGWALSITSGGPVYGWVPLGWGDPYVPWWGRGGCGQRCWTHYNRPFAVPYVANRAERPHVPATYANDRVPGAVTAVAGATLAAQRPVGTNLVAVPAGAPRAPVLAGAPTVRPLRLPETRPVGTPPAPASTFYPSARPRHPVNPPVTSAAPADPSGRMGAERPRELRQAPGQPSAAVPPTSARPSFAAPAAAVPPASAPPSRAAPPAAVPPPPTGAPPTFTRPSPAGPATATPPAHGAPSGSRPSGTAGAVPAPGGGSIAAPAVPAAPRPESRPAPSRQPAPAVVPRSSEGIALPPQRGVPPSAAPPSRAPVVVPQPPAAAPSVPSVPVAPAAPGASRSPTPHGAPAPRGGPEPAATAPAGRLHGGSKQGAEGAPASPR